MLRICLSVSIALFAAAQTASADRHLFNTVKQKLAQGKQVVGGTIYTSDPNVYCAMAHAGFDFLWIEMQHSPLNYDQVAKMIWACRDAPAIPFIRIPDATEGDLQKATDIGALGIVVPMVDTVEEARERRSLCEVSSAGQTQPRGRAVRQALGQREIPRVSQRQHDDRGDDRKPGGHRDRRQDRRRGRD